MKQNRCFHALLGAGAWLVLPLAAQASLIVAPHSAGRDADLAGVVVAAPDDGSSALIANPAGVVSRARDENLVSLMPITFKMHYESPVSGYKESGRKDAVAIGLWHGLGESNGWSRGVGVYGSLGTAFDMPSSPQTGQSSPYLGETGILNFGFNIGRQVSPALRVGLQIAPRYGMQQIKSPSPLGDISFKTQGVGIGGAIGLVYTPASDLALGLVYRTPGIVRFKGDGRVGEQKQDLRVSMITPQNITAGLAYDISPRLKLLAQLGWTRYQDFERGEKKFEHSKLLNGAVVANAKNRLRSGLALEYQLASDSYLRAGITRGRAMIEDNAMSPIMFDVDNDMLMFGYETSMNGWRLGVTGGYTDNKPRTVSAAQSPYFSGTYKDQTPLTFGFRATWDID